jgi:MFS family permease
VPSLSLPGRLAPLRERPYRLFFSASTISTLGDSVAGIALAFAVLDLTGSPRPLYLAIVFAGRQLANGALVLYGGVLSDRLPRKRRSARGRLRRRPLPSSSPATRRSCCSSCSRSSTAPPTRS